MCGGEGGHGETPSVRQIGRIADLAAQSAPEGRGSRDGPEAIPRSPPYFSMTYVVFHFILSQSGGLKTADQIPVLKAEHLSS